MITLEYELHSKVENFKKWALRNYPLITEDMDNGEWELDSKEFHSMYDCAIKTIEMYNDKIINSKLADDLLYSIARDNECSRIINYLIEFPKAYSQLCTQCLQTNYTNAKWQFAESLKDYKGNDDFSHIIFSYLDTGDEYTERMALMSLAHLYPNQAEDYAIKFWNRNKYENDEYQKIMVLHVLYKIKSFYLEKYLDLAENSNYMYLIQNAKEIRDLIAQ